jgi:uncharacterized Zn-binding protein involved in type VI secretion
MPGAVRKGDRTNRHGGWFGGPKRYVITAASTVFWNNKPAHRLGDFITPHHWNKPQPLVQASPNVFVENKPAGRKGDKYACGLKSETASTTVFIN